MNRLTQQEGNFFENPEEQNFDAFDINEFSNELYLELQKYENFMELYDLNNIDELNNLIGHSFFEDGYNERNVPVRSIEYITYKQECEKLKEENKVLRISQSSTHKTLMQVNEELQKLKRQLKEKEKENLTLRERYNGVINMNIQEFDKLQKELETEYQDKISFAVEQLEKVSQEFSMRVGITDNNMDLLNEIIDNQIEELKKEMK